MNSPFIVDQTFKNKDYTKTSLPKAEYDNCTFIGCFFEGSYLSTISFLECEFINCNLANTKLKEATFKDVSFLECKMIGMPFYECNSFLFSANFKQCNLDIAAFNNLKLTGTVFTDCSLQQTDFSESDLTKSTFGNCNLKDAIFKNTILEGTDFRTAYKLSFNPNDNRMKGAKFSESNVHGLLVVHHIIIE
jgi:fluoroquinolone resistance protein